MFAGTVILAALFFTVGGLFMKLLRESHQVLADLDRLCLVCHRSRAANAGDEARRSRRHLLLVVGLESILAFLFGVLLFSESCTPLRIAGVLLITGGIVSLRSAY
jgi:hypothetical protein